MIVTESDIKCSRCGSTNTFEEFGGNAAGCNDCNIEWRV